MPTLSVVMIVKNEAHCLAECLASVRDAADEIVVADTGSTDNTISIARDFNARVLSIPWNNDFAEARNRSIAAATGDWLLHMDADEVLDSEGARRIREVVDADGRTSDGTVADAVEVTLANYCDEPRAWRWLAVEPGAPMARGKSGYIAAPLLRLFRNRRGFEYREPVHENITESVLEARGVIRPEPIIIHHHGYGGQSADSDTKAKLYLEIGRKKTQQRPEDPKAWHDLAEQLAATGLVEEAETAARTALRYDPYHVGAATVLANLLLNRGDLSEARTLLEGLERAGFAPPHVVMALGAIACKQGRLEEARLRLEAVITADPKAIMALLYLARTFDRLGDASAARRQLERATTVAPALAEPRERLQAHRLRTQAESLFNDGQTQTALPALVQALQLDPEDPVTHNDIGVVLSTMGEFDAAARSFERALLLAPDMPEAVENLRALKRV